MVMNQPNTGIVGVKRSPAKGASGPGSNYGNGGLSGGLGASPAALAFLMLTELQAKYQEILQKKADLSSIAAKAAKAQVTAQNRHYSNEVTDQAWQQYGQAIASGCTAVATGASMFNVGIMKGANKAMSEMNSAEKTVSDFSSLQKDMAAPKTSETVISRGQLTGKQQSTVERLVQDAKNDHFDDLAKETNSDVRKAVGAHLRGEARALRAAGFNTPEAAAGAGGRATPEELKGIQASIESRISQYSRSATNNGIVFQSQMMKLNMVNQMTDKLFQALSSTFTGLNKTDNWFGAGGECEKQAHNQGQLNILYGQLAQSVMNNVSQQVFKAWDLENAVMTQILKSIADAQRV